MDHAITSNEDWEDCLKVLTPDYRSILAVDYDETFHVKYAVGEISRADPTLDNLGYHLFAFLANDFGNVVSFILNLSDRHRQYVRVYRALGRGRSKVPGATVSQKSRLTDLVNYILHGGYDLGGVRRRYDWPTGTVCYREIELVRDAQPDLDAWLATHGYSSRLRKRILKEGQNA